MTTRVLAIAAGFLLAASDFASAVGPCDADINHDGVVNTLDLGILLSSWTLPPATACSGTACDADLDGSGVVNTLDLGILLSAFGTICNQPTETQLAGNALPSYPFFDYVTAFNFGAPVQVALDPTRFPSIVGDTASIYIVADKTAAQWAVNPALVDVTPGGALTVTFAAGSIQANTFTVDTGTLSAAAGTGLGVAYDVVVDMNQNGVVDAADYIAGLSGAGGMYVVHDLTLPGPLAVTELDYTVTGTTAGFASENTFYPTNIAAMGQLPLVVVSHGNGHFYQWYDHIGNHLASYGFIVMSHANDTMPGPVTASTTTLQHTNAIIGQAATIAGGVLNGHIDTNRIIWVGHSRGGEGVAIAYDRVFDGAFAPVGWNLNSLKLVASICPTDFQGLTQSNPHNGNYQLFYTGADGDVTGSPGTGSKPFAIYERGTGTKHVTYLHGAGHGDFHNGGGSSVASGPALIGRPATHKVLLSYLLAMAQHYVNGNVPAEDYLKRMYQSIHPIGIDTFVTVAKEYADSAASGIEIIDDYQTNTSLGTSSSGGAVTMTVSNAAEGQMLDGDGSFDFSAGVPFNGMTRSNVTVGGDNPRCVVFDWNTAASVLYQLSIVPALQDFSDNAYLSFRACQGTRHPETDALNAPLSFAVTLRDGNGVTSTIRTSNYGTISRTYLRTGFGVGAGWCNEFSTVRIRLSDFLNNGSGLDLSQITIVRFEFGAAVGSVRGRIGLDDIQLTPD